MEAWENFLSEASIYCTVHSGTQVLLREGPRVGTRRGQPTGPPPSVPGTEGTGPQGGGWEQQLFSWHKTWKVEKNPKIDQILQRMWTDISWDPRFSKELLPFRNTDLVAWGALPCVWHTQARANLGSKAPQARAPWWAGPLGMHTGWELPELQERQVEGED